MNAECRMQNAECRIEKWVFFLHSSFCILRSAFIFSRCLGIAFQGGGKPPHSEGLHRFNVFTRATTSFSNDVPPNSLFTSRIQPYMSSLSTVRTVMSWLPVPEAIRLLRS